jgi:hypothetical protein
MNTPEMNTQYRHPGSQLSQTCAVASPSPATKSSEVSNALDTIDSNLSRLAESLAVLLQRIEPVLSPICKEEKDGGENCPAPPESPLVLKLREQASKIDFAVRVIQAAGSRIQL